MKRYLKHFADKEKKYASPFIQFLRNLSRKQIVAISLIGLAFTVKFSYAMEVTSDDAILGDSFQSMYKILIGREYNANAVATDKVMGYAHMFISSYWVVELIKNMMKYIIRMQTKSITTISELDFGNIDMFEHIVSGLTIFAVIGCLYKLIMHFLKTERFDNVRAYTGFFSYLGIFVLFIFSQQIVDRIIRLNQPMDTSVITNIFVKIDNELNNKIKADFEQAQVEMERLDNEFEALGINDISDKIVNRFENVKVQFWDMGMKHMFKYCYYAFFSIVLAVVLAVPAFTIAFMVKILLGIMIAGTKLVFLISFIPGFENTWKTFITNLLNVILWVPIFTAIISFLTAIVQVTITDDAMEYGQIIWLTIVVCVGAYQSLALTTTGAGVIIQGAGASMAGAMGSLAGMNAASMVAGAGQAALSTAVTAYAGGASAGASMASAMKKYSK